MESVAGGEIFSFNHWLEIAMKYVAGDSSHKVTDAAQTAAMGIADSTAEDIAQTLAERNRCENIADTFADSSRPQCENCSLVIDGVTMNLLREMHPAQRRLCSVPRRLDKDEHLFQAGDRLDAVYVVQSGVFKRYFNNDAGDETVADFARTGQLLGIEALLHGNASMAAVALVEDASVCALPLTALSSVPDAFWSQWLMSTICEERERERLLRSIHDSQITAESRLAFFLLDHATGHGRRGLCGHSVRLAIPQHDIASYLDLDEETTSRAFSRLQHAGIIRFERTALTIVEPDLLFMLAPPGKHSKSGSLTELQRDRSG
jgi:CRP/FNR family transcriptional regulator